MEWRPIPGYESLYMVSNDGQVMAITEYHRHKPNRLLKIRIDRGGYPYVGLYKNKKQKFYKVHRLVALAFLESPPETYTQINHKDGNKLNNHTDNLEWCTASMNLQHSINVLNRKVRKGSEIHGILTDDKVREIRTLAANGMKQAEIAKRFGVSRSNVQKIILRTIWRHVL